MPEELPENPLIQRMLLGANCIVHNPRLSAAFQSNERRMAKFSESMDPGCVGRKAGVLQYTQFPYVDESTRRRMSHAATLKPGKFEEKWDKLDLAPTAMRGTADLQEAALIVMSVKPEIAILGNLLIRTALGPFGCEEVKIKHGGKEDRPAGKLVVPKFPVETMNDEQGQSGSGRNEGRVDEEKEDRQPEKAMEEDPDQAGRDDDKASVGGASSLDFNFLDDDEVGTETLTGTTEPAEDGTSLSLYESKP